MEQKTNPDIISFFQGRGDDRPIIIQPHDFPDHDAIASAYALHRLFGLFNLPSRIITSGGIQRASLQTFIEDLNIPMEEMPAEDLKETDWVIIVDGCKGNTNITDLPGQEVAVLDHHKIMTQNLSEITGENRFIEIRPELGSCATLIGLYYEELKIPLPRDVATAILCGISFDTRNFTGRVHSDDLKIYSTAHEIGDTEYVKRMLRNNIQFSDLVYFQKLFSEVQIFDSFAYCYYPQGCSQNLLGILSSFTLSIDSVHFVLLAAQEENLIRLSARSEEPSWDAARIICRLIGENGRGGGHRDMAGGVITKWDANTSHKLPEELKELLILKK